MMYREIMVKLLLVLNTNIFNICKYIKKYSFFYRTINIPSVNTAVEQVTNWQTRSTQKDDGIPLSSPPPPPNMEKDVPNAADKPKKGQKNSGSKKMTDPNKELQIEISETDKASCTPFFCKQTARRGKPFIKQSEPEQKTLAQLKKQIKIEPQETVEVVKEDCHVQIDDSSYGDWL